MWRLKAALRRVLASVGLRSGDSEVDEELRAHIEMATERNLERGMGAADARREALLRFGGADRAREAAWDVERSRLLEDAWQDVRLGVRLLVRAPAFAAAAILTLALGIGANAAIFSVLDAVLLRDLPYGEPGQLVAFTPNGYDAYRAWTEGSRALESSGAYTYSIANVSGGAEPVRVWTLAVTSSLLPALGVVPLHGPGFTEVDDSPGAPPRAMLRHGFWLAHFGGDVGLVGRAIELNGEAHELVGVLPDGFEFPPPARGADGSMPRTADVWLGVGRLSDLHERGGFFAAGRLAAGSSAEAAAAELNAVANAIATNRAEPIRVDVRRVEEAVEAPLRPAVIAFTAGVGLVLLIACANLGSLLLARLAGRQRELAMRVAIGASPARIVRQVLAESSVLAFAGAAAGVGVAWLGLDALLALAPPELARVSGAALNGRVLLFSLGLAALTALLIGLLPAARALRRDPNEALGSTRGATGDRATGRIHGVLVAGEVALAVVLLIGAGLLLRSFASLASVDPGFDTDGLVTADVLLPPDRYATRDAVLGFFDELEARLDGAPGVRAISAIDRLPYGPSLSRVPFQIAGEPAPAGADPPLAVNTSARPGYFEAMGIPLLDGREFTAADRTDAPPVVIIGRSLAERHWPYGSALGARVEVFGVEREVVGVAGDVRHLGPATPADPIVYLPQPQDAATRRSMTIVVRADGAANDVLARLRSEIRALDPRLPVSNLHAFDALRSERTASERFNALLIACFALLAALLAAVGIHGVTSFAVAQRRREIGVRIALGATRGAVLATFLRRAMRSVVFGAAAGIAAALALTRLARSLLFGVTPTDPLTYAAVALIVAGFTLAAAWIPAHRAARTDPRAVLGAE